MDELVLISVRERPEWADRMIAFFRRHWATEASGMVYEDCIRSSIGAKSPTPQWYALAKGDRVVAGCGLIANDFISRMDLTPWLAALYVEEEFRSKGLGERLVRHCLAETGRLGYDALYLCTDHVGYYERFGFEQIATGYHPWGESSRILAARTRNAAACEARADIIGGVIDRMRGEHRFGCDELPDRRTITGILSDVQAFMFPAFSSGECVSERMLLEKIRWALAQQIRRAMRFAGDSALNPEAVADRFLEKIPGIYEMLIKDIEALYEGDPAASSREEVIIAYPGFFAIVVYRIAHALYEMKVPIIPRIMTEFVHQKTGIDIHAGAKIGEYFFIDHGTGIVIGETTVIGDHVKLYQGVTLGAKSFELDEDGNPVKGIKRHPNIGNHVVIYANATILGGSTTIGDHCTIGGNVWLTSSVEPGRTVYYKGE